jgi:hypothetical protein
MKTKVRIRYKKSYQLSILEEKLNPAEFGE